MVYGFFIRLGIGACKFCNSFFQEVSRIINSPESKVKVIFFLLPIVRLSPVCYTLCLLTLHIFDLFPGTTEPNLAKHDVTFPNVLLWVFNAFLQKEDTKSVKKTKHFFKRKTIAKLLK